MGNRLSRIYTRTGDDGTTGLADGTRLPKDALRVDCIGTVDELNSVLGVVLSVEVPDAVRAVLEPVQHVLFDIGGELALPARPTLDADAVSELEQQLDKLNAELPPLKEFILPGGNTAAAYCHLARAVCRRAERLLVRLSREDGNVNAHTLHYLNRLSDVLFVAARIMIRHAGDKEVYWRPRSKP